MFKKISLLSGMLVLSGFTVYSVFSHVGKVNAATPCIVTIFGQQYDVSPLQTPGVHPGGNIFVCGSDMTAVYQGMHGTDVTRILPYLITPTPTPTPTVTPTETPTPTVTPTETPTPTVTPTVSPTETPTPTVSPTVTPVPSVSPKPDDDHDHESDQGENYESNHEHQHENRHHGEHGKRD